MATAKIDPQSRTRGRTALLWGLALAAAVIVVGLPAGVWASDAFDDVPEANTHHDAIGTITDAGVTLGCAAGQYCPSNAVRRDQMASFMDRLGALSGQDPVVNAATAVTAETADSVEGMDAVLERLDELEADNAALAARTAELEAAEGDDNGALATRVDDLEADNAALATRVEELEAAEGGDNGALAARVDDLEDTVAALDGMVTGQAETMTALQSTVTTQGGTIDDLDTRVTDLEEAGTGGGNGELAGRVEALETTFAGVTREEQEIGEGDVAQTLVFEGMNLQLLNGAEDAEGQPLNTTASANGLGNLIIGYNAQRSTPVDRTGSHYLVIGDEHSWTSWGGIVNGFGGTTSAEYASVLGGQGNTASGEWAWVGGGGSNVANGVRSSVSGGVSNEATGTNAAVNGGTANVASGTSTSILGGSVNTASGHSSTVSAGRENTASGSRSSVSGGDTNEAAGFRASVSGGEGNTASGDYSSILGGLNQLVDVAHGQHPTP